jgi:hypothetical protein
VTGSQKKGSWHWEQLVEWKTSIREWVITEALIDFFARHLNISVAAVHHRLQLGDLPGFFKEVRADPEFKKGAKRAGDFLFSQEREKGPKRLQRSSELMGKWERDVYERC